MLDIYTQFSHKPTDAKVDITDVWDNPPETDYHFVDICCGIGGLCLGIMNAGIKPILGCDWDMKRVAGYLDNFEHSLLFGDITDGFFQHKIYSRIKELKKTPDILTFGVEQQKEYRIKPNDIYKHIALIIKALKPKVFICEHTRSALSPANGWAYKALFDFALDILEETGYKVDWNMVDCQNYAIPQSKERVVIIGNSMGKENKLPYLNKPKITVKESIGDLYDREEDEGFGHKFTTRKSKQEEFANLKPGESANKMNNKYWQKLDENKISCTIYGNVNCRPIHPKYGRFLSVREIARLSTFPDSYTLNWSGSEYVGTMVGRATPPNLAKALGLATIKMIEE